MDAATLTALPKAELHLHIEGTLEPELMFALARRNNVDLPYPDVESVRAAYSFTNLQSFLDIYYRACSVLLSEEDFYELGRAYLERAHRDGVTRAEIFFDPQTHTERGIPIRRVVDGLARACREAEQAHGMSSGLILCFLRHLPESEALTTLEEALAEVPEAVIGVGLDSSEVGHPPRDFRRVFAEAQAAGLHRVAHAGEEGPPDYVWQALDLLGVERIDHGIRSIEDPRLVERLVADAIPLTICPLSNVSLRAVERLEQHPLRRLLEAGVLVTINSDDPAYFGGYIGDNYRATAAALNLDDEQVRRIAANSLCASFGSSDRSR